MDDLINVGLIGNNLLGVPPFGDAVQPLPASALAPPIFEPSGVLLETGHYSLLETGDYLIVE